MVFILNVPPANTNEVLSIYSTYYDPASVTPTSFDLLFDTSLNRLYLPRSDSLGAYITSLVPNAGTITRAC